MVTIVYAKSLTVSLRKHITITLGYLTFGEYSRWLPSTPGYLYSAWPTVHP